MKAGRPPSLTAEAVREIRSWHAARKRTGVRLDPPAKRMAGRLGISVKLVYDIANRQSYKWVL